MRAPRMLTPDTIYFVTNRCEQEQFLLLPSKEMNQIIGGWLGRTLEQYGEGIEIYGFIFMSNHFHILLKDKLGVLPKFMWYFQTNLAKAINANLERRGRIFARRYDAAIVADDKNVLSRLQYTLGNAVKAGLVKKSSQWIGLTSYDATLNNKELNFKQFDATAYITACQAKGKKEVKKENFIKTYNIPIVTPECLIKKDGDEKRVKHEINELLKNFEERYSTERKFAKKSVLGITKVLQHKHTDRPQNPSFSPRVLIFCENKEIKKEFLESREIFTGLYLEASDALKQSIKKKKSIKVEWPDYSCPPLSMIPVGYAA